MNRRRIAIGVFIIIINLIIGRVGLAQDTEKEVFEIKEDEIVRKDLITKRDIITNKGTIVGDIMAISKAINNYGLVHGDILGLSQEISVEGVVKGDIRAWTNSLSIKGEVNKNILLMTRNLLIEDKGVVDGSITLLGEKAVVNGMVGADIRGYVETLVINGEIKGDVDVSVQSLKLGPSCKIGGDLRYKGPKPTSINHGYIGGNIKFTKAPEPLKLDYIKRIVEIITLILKISFKSGVYVLGILFVVLFPEEAKSIPLSFEKEELKIPLMGFCYLVIVPAICGILFITLMGISIGVLTVILYTITLYLAKIPVSILIGNLVFKHRFNTIFNLLFGLIIIDIFNLIPYISIISTLLTFILGTGIVLFLLLKNKDFECTQSQYKSEVK